MNSTSMRSVSRAQPRGLAAACLVLASLIGALVVGPNPVRAQPSDAVPPRVREVYVPFEHFRRLCAEQPEGVVVELAEYRRLVARALRMSTVPPEPVLPPIAAHVEQVRYVGQVLGSVARFTARLTVHSHRPGWVRCALGASLPYPGRVQTDGESGWLLHDREHDEFALLVSGEGVHEVTIEFTVPLTEDGERSRLAGRLLTATSAELELRVPGAAAGVAQPPVLTTELGARETIFRLPLGRVRDFALEWTRQKTLDQNPALLTAEHRLAFEPSPDNPRFRWQAHVEIARRTLDTFEFSEPAGMTVLQVTGELVHSWSRRDDAIRVQLKAPHRGELDLSLRGAFAMNDMTFTLRTPNLLGSTRNRGQLVIVAPAQERVRVDATSGLREIDPGAATLPATPEEASQGTSRPLTVLRAYSFPDDGGELRGRVESDPLRFEARASYLVRPSETSLTLVGFVQVQVLAGQTYDLTLDLPAGWRAVRLAPAGRSATNAAELALELTEDRLVVRSARALTTAAPLELEVSLEDPSYSGDRDWQRRDLAFALPTWRGAERTRTDLAIALHHSLVLATTDLPQWRVLPTEESQALGLLTLPHSEEPDPPRVVATLTTDSPRPQVQVALEHRATRGEVRSVTHVLAAERSFRAQADRLAVRVRTDLHLAVVDRAVDEVVLRHPLLPNDASVVVLGDGIKEVASLPAEGRQRIRFTRPWIGTRHLRLEYEVAHPAGERLPFPEVQVDADFGREEFVVIQSQGSVEVAVEPGDGVTNVELDDVPDFAVPWDDGRTLTAYRFRRGGAPGSFRTALHERAPVLGRLAREMKLSTMIGEDGTVRTRAEVLLVYAREQNLRFTLPRGARALAATVDGEPVRALRSHTGSNGEIEYALPLPPRSHALVALLYEERRGGLTAWGTWRAEAPRLLDLPVGATHWALHHPVGYRFDVRGGNVRADDPEREQARRRLVTESLGRWLRGRGLDLTLLDRDTPPRVHVSIPAFPSERLAEARAAWSGERQDPLSSSRIRPRSTTGDVTDSERAPQLELVPEGLLVPVSKLGGDAVVKLSYYRLGWDRFARAFVLLGTWLGCCSLWVLGRRKALVKLIACGLFLGTAIPAAFDWDSSLLALPFCEALATFTLAWLAVAAGRALLGRWRRRRADPMANEWGLASALVPMTLWLALVGSAPGVLAAEDEVLPPAREGVIPPPFDVVLVPYDPNGSGWPEPSGKAFLGKEQFLALWRQAYPEAREPLVPEPPVANATFSIGNAEYRLELLRDETYRLRGTLFVQLWTRESVGLALPFDRAQLTRVAVDGVDVGVFQVAQQPVVEIRGVGAHRLELELAGTVAADAGEYRIATEILAGAATQVLAALPRDAELTATAPGVASWLDDADTADTQGPREVRVDLGQSSTLRITWSFPRIEGQLSSQRESLSYSELRLLDDGFSIHRREDLRIAGRGLERVSYRVLGDWEISSVEGADLSEWTLTRSPAGPILLLNFTRPVNSASLTLVGHARMASAGPLPTLELIDAIRQETYVGLFHGAQRRFGPESLAGMSRSVGQSLPQPPAGSDGTGPDRLHHAFGAATSERLQITPDILEQRVTSEAVAWVRDDQVQVYVRTTYTSALPGSAPRHVVPLPPTWNVRRLRGDDVRQWEVREEGGQRALWVELNASARSGTTLTWSAEFALDPLPTRFSLPALSSVVASPNVRREEACHWWVVCGEELEPRALEDSPWEPADRTAPDWLPIPNDTGVRLAFRARRTSAPLALELARSSTQLAVTDVAFARVGVDFVEVVGRLDFRVRGAGRDTFRLRLPTNARLVLLDVDNQQSQELRETAAGTEVTIRLQSPARGSVPMTLRYRVPRPPGSPPSLRGSVFLDGAAPIAEADHYVAVVQTQRSITLEAHTEGLHPVAVEALPYVPDDISASSLGPAYRATRPDWSLSLGEQEIEMAEGPAAVIKLAELATIIGHDGTRRTEVIYTLINRRLQFLTVELPDSGTLWGVTVNGRPVAVGRKGGTQRGAIQIPVERMIGSDLPLEVAIIYEEPRLALPAYRESTGLAAPQIPREQAVGVHESVWSVQFPNDYAVHETAHRMRPVPPSLRSAEKLRALLDQQEQLLEATQSYTSRRAQEQASQQLARISQALGDNFAELQDRNRSDAEVRQQTRLGAQSLEQQWSANDRLLDDTRKARAKLAEEIRTNNDRAAAPSTPDEQSFADRTQFLLGRGWRRGSQHRESATGTDEAVAPAFDAIDAALTGQRYPGLNQIQGVNPPSATERAEPQDIAAKDGLLPLPEAARPTAGNVFEPSRTRPGYTTFTFQRGDADAFLELEFSRPGLGSRIFAGLGLLAFGAVLILRRWLQAQ
ncbi:MAG: hypothetical protein AB7O52_03040 [Planctomycetota bacterium]